VTSTGAFACSPGLSEARERQAELRQFTALRRIHRLFVEQHFAVLRDIDDLLIDKLGCARSLGVPGSCEFNSFSRRTDPDMTMKKSMITKTTSIIGAI
jgi:hypothetical protein